MKLPKELFKRYCEIDISKHIQNGRNTVVFSIPEIKESSINKGIRLYIELVGKDDNEYIW